MQLYFPHDRCLSAAIARTGLAIALIILLAPAVRPARAEDAASQASTTPDPYHELETKYLFGFTDGSDIGEEGEKSVEFETTTAFGMRRGSYRMIEQEFEFEGVPTPVLRL